MESWLTDAEGQL